MTDGNAREILDVQTTATPREIKARYRTLARRYHPDVNGGDASSEWMFKQLNAAYHQLHGKGSPAGGEHPEQRARPQRTRQPRKPTGAHDGTAHDKGPPATDWQAAMRRRKQENLAGAAAAIISFAAGQGAGHVSAWRNWADAAGPWADMLYPIPFSVAVGLAVGLAVGAVTLTGTVIGLEILSTTPGGGEERSGD